METESITFSERFNAGVDNLMAASDRILQLPLYVLAPGVALLVIVATVVVRKLMRPGRPGTWRVLYLGYGLIALAAIGYAADRRIRQLQDQLETARARFAVLTVSSGLNSPISTAPDFTAEGTPLAPDKGTSRVASMTPTPSAPPERAATAAAEPKAEPVALPPTESGTVRTPSPILEEAIGQTLIDALPVPGSQNRKVDSIPVSATTGTSNVPASPETKSADPGPLIDQDSAAAALSGILPGATFEVGTYNPAAAYVRIHVRRPLIEAYLVVIDLQDAGLTVEVGADLSHKTLTSDFARQTGAFVAINGEAGMSPSPRAALGNWVGNLMAQGTVLVNERAQTPRPFLVFARNNRATFRSSADPDRKIPSTAYNLIWGRWDALVSGVVRTADERNRQPRTAMGIDAEGKKLFLLVADGRQPSHSMGLTRAEVGYILKAFGATDGMLCDEGGSSSLFLANFGGIVNVPSDGHGKERPTYTHFGVALQTAP